MARKRLTQLFPFLLPIRVWQRNLFYQISMCFDQNRYAKKKGALLPFSIVQEKTLMINQESGHNIVYQENKVHNLKVVSRTMSQILIYPGETFSFCYLSKHARKYKDGLILINDSIVPSKGGGICHLSNLLYYVFLMSPLTIVERHGHKIKSFPNPDLDSLDGVDATVSSGWLDLKVRNDTDFLYQVVIDFDSDYMYVALLSDHEKDTNSVIQNENFQYFRKDGKIFERVSVVKLVEDLGGNVISKKKLYDELVQIDYELPDDILVIEEDPYE